MLGILVNIILKRGEGIEAANVLKACQEQTSFKLLWKSFITKQKKQFKEKWVSLELP